MISSRVVSNPFPLRGKTFLIVVQQGDGVGVLPTYPSDCWRPPLMMFRVTLLFEQCA